MDSGKMYMWFVWESKQIIQAQISQETFDIYVCLYQNVAIN